MIQTGKQKSFDQHPSATSICLQFEELQLLVMYMEVIHFFIFTHYCKEKVIPTVINYFSNTSLNETVRAKIGEALLFIAKRCGETLPHYGT